MMEEHGINNVFQRSDVKLKLKETWEIKYGYDNPSKSDIIKKKKRDKWAKCSITIDELIEEIEKFEEIIIK